MQTGLGIATALSHLPSKLHCDIQLRRNQILGKLLYWFSSTHKPEELDIIALRCIYIYMQEYITLQHLSIYTISEGTYRSESQCCFIFRKEQEAWQVLPTTYCQVLHHLPFLRKGLQLCLLGISFKLKSYTFYLPFSGFSYLPTPKIPFLPN